MQFEIGVFTLILVLFVTPSCYGQNGQYIPGYEWIGLVNCSLVVTPSSLSNSASSSANGGRKVCVMRIQNWLPNGVFNLTNSIAKCSLACTNKDTCSCLLEIQPSCSLIYQNVKYTNGQHPIVKSQNTPVCQLNKFSPLPSLKYYKYYCSLKANVKAHYQRNFSDSSDNSRFLTLKDSTYSCTLGKVAKGSNVSPSSLSSVNIVFQGSVTQQCPYGYYYCWPGSNFFPNLMSNALSSVLQFPNINCYSSNYYFNYNTYAYLYSSMCTTGFDSATTVRFDNLASLVSISDQVIPNNQKIFNYGYGGANYISNGFYIDYDITMELSTIESFTVYVNGNSNPGVSPDWIGQIYSTQPPFYQSTYW